MTNKEAIDRIEDHLRIHFQDEYPYAVRITEALRMGIDALKEQDPKVMSLKELEETKDPVFIELRTKGKHYNFIISHIHCIIKVAKS